MVLDKRNLLPRLGQDGPVRLDIGCGPSKTDPASIGVDALDFPGVDLVGDVYEVLAHFPDASVDAVRSAHFFEHVADLPRLIGELERVLKPGATLTVVVPHFSNPYFYSDPTHRSFFGLYTFCYYAECRLFAREVPTYGRTPALRLERVRLRFKSPRPFYLRYGIKRLVEALVNLCAYTQELYEDLFTGIVGCYEVEFQLQKK